MRSLLDRGWQIDREGPDGIVATTVAKGHSATVLVQFDAQSYAISYLDSSPGLKFNGGVIHRRYNDWIDRLDKTIRKQLASGEAYPPQQVVPVTPAPAVAAPIQLPPALPEPAPATAAAPAPPPTGAPAVAPKYEAPPPPPPAPAPRR